MFGAQLKVGGDWSSIMGVRRVWGKMPLLHLTRARSDVLLEAYLGERFRYLGQARGSGVALKGGVNVARARNYKSGGNEEGDWHPSKPYEAKGRSAFSCHGSGVCRLEAPYCRIRARGRGQRTAWLLTHLRLKS